MSNPKKILIVLEGNTTEEILKKIDTVKNMLNHKADVASFDMGDNLQSFFRYQDRKHFQENADSYKILLTMKK